MKRYRLAVFDLDGTLLNTLDDLAAATNHALAAHDLPPRTTDEVRRFVGNGIANLIRRAVPAGSPADLVEAVYATFNAYYAAHSLDVTAPYPGIPSPLDELRARGVRCCVVSNKGDYAVGPLVEHFFGDAFEVAVGEREGLRRKPCPDTVLACMDACQIPPADTVYIGDSEVDVATAEAAGIDCVCVTWGFRPLSTLLEAGASTIVDDTDQLLAAICGS